MTQTFQPFGLSLVEHKGGKPNYPITIYPLSPNTGNPGAINTGAGFAAGGTGCNFGQGDVMCISAVTTNPGISAYQANTSAGTPQAQASLIAGVFDSVQYTAINGTVTPGQYWSANTPVFGGYNTVGSIGSTDVDITLNDLPYCVYRVQCNAPLPSNGAYFLNYNLTTNGGVYSPTNTPAQGWLGANPATKQSTQAVNVNAGPIGAGSLAGSVKIIGLAPQSDVGGPNNWTDQFPIVYVTFNGSVFNSATTSA